MGLAIDPSEIDNSFRNEIDNSSNESSASSTPFNNNSLRDETTTTNKTAILAFHQVEKDLNKFKEEQLVQQTEKDKKKQNSHHESSKAEVDSAPAQATIIETVSKRRGSISSLLDGAKGIAESVMGISKPPVDRPVVSTGMSRVNLALTPPSSSRNLNLGGGIENQISIRAAETWGIEEGEEEERSPTIAGRVRANSMKVMRNIAPKAKFKAAARMIGLRHSLGMKAEEADTVPELPNARRSSGSRRQNSLGGISGKKPLAAGEKAQEKIRLKKKQEAKHENLVDQLKLRKKTSQIKEFKDQDQTKKFEEYQKMMELEKSKICGIFVWSSSSRGVRYWEILIAVLVFFQVFMVPYSLVFSPEIGIKVQNR